METQLLGQSDRVSDTSTTYDSEAKKALVQMVGEAWTLDYVQKTTLGGSWEAPMSLNATRTFISKLPSLSTSISRVSVLRYLGLHLLAEFGELCRPLLFKRRKCLVDRLGNDVVSVPLFVRRDDVPLCPLW